MTEAPGRGRKPSAGQLSRIRELSQRILGHANVAFAVAGEPADAREATLILKALDAAAHPIDVRQSRRRRIFTDTWTRLSGRKPMPTVTIEPPKRDEPWHLWAARHIGLDGKRTEPCSRCGGTGTVTATKQPSRSRVARLLLDMPDGSNPSMASIRRLRDPRLTDLERIAELLGGDLAAAAEFCRILAGML